MLCALRLYAVVATLLCRQRCRYDAVDVYAIARVTLLPLARGAR